MDYDEYSVVPIPARSRMEVQDDPDFQMVGEVKTNPEPVLPVAVKNVADDTSDTDDEVSEAVAAAFRRCQKKKVRSHNWTLSGALSLLECSLLLLTPADSSG